MVECNSIESIEHNSIDTSNLNNQQFRMNKISEIEDDFITEIKEREFMSKKLSKYISFFDYFHKSLILLSVTSGGVSIASGLATNSELTAVENKIFDVSGLVKKMIIIMTNTLLLRNLIPWQQAL